MDEITQEPGQDTQVTETAEPIEALSIDTIEDDLAALLLEEEKPEVEEAEQEAEEDEVPETETDEPEGIDEIEGEADTEQKAIPDEQSAAPEPKRGKLTAQERIQQLAAQKRELAEELERVKAEREEAEKRYATTSEQHPDPQAELETLKEQYAQLPTAQQVIEAETINPATEMPYTPAEAEAALANLKQDIMFRINDTKDAVVQRMEQARVAETLATQLGDELNQLISQYPELDPNSPKANKPLCKMLGAVIKSNQIETAGLLSGWDTPPKEFLKEFKDMVLSQTLVRANAVSKTNGNIEAVPTKVKPEETKVQTATDPLLAAFDDAMNMFGA
jgi:DNA repair exonuclease SbcCD ATPase subunit